jgi:hypothetical protein
MLRIILGAIVGFIVWLILLRGSDFIGATISPDWFGKYLNDFATAINNKTPYTADSVIMIMLVIRSAVLSVIAGFVAAVISKENFKSPLIAGILLLALGAFVSFLIGNYAPIWYHLGILLPLIPMTLIGGKLRKV